jgi:hypothetical protein
MRDLRSRSRRISAVAWVRKSSVAAIKRFAGEDYARARYYPADNEFLLERETRVQHFDVLANMDPKARS